MTGKIVIRNLLHKPQQTLITFLLLVLGVAMISFLVTLQEQLRAKMDGDKEGIDLVIGAKGSPLQLVLSSIYQLDAPTGNIPQKEANAFAQNPMVKQAIPLAYGDSFKGFKILGTETSYLSLYKAEYQDGDAFTQDMDAVIGADVAKTTGLKLGSTFHGTHGMKEGGHVHEEFEYRVTGILKPAGRVIDQLIITPLQSVWNVHDAHEGHTHDEHHGHEHEVHDHEHHQHEHNTKDITAMLLQLKSPMGAVTLPRSIPPESNLQAVVPNLEIARLFSLLGIGVSSFKAISIGIITIAGISILVSLYNRVEERKYELALGRVLGAGKFEVGRLVFLEGLALLVSGIAGGLLISKLAFYYLVITEASNLTLVLNPWKFSTTESTAVLLVFTVGLLITLIPTLKTYRIDLSKTLSDES